MSFVVSFVHLRIHSEYSVIDSIIKFKPLFNQLNAIEMPAVALTDECNLYAAVKFYTKATAAGIKPIFGTDLRVRIGEQVGRLTLLCESDAGLANLIKLISKAYLEGERPDVVPIIEFEWLTVQNCEGLIALSGALEGHIGQSLINKDGELENTLEGYLKLFPDNRFYIEIQRLGKPNENAYLAEIIPFAEKHSIPVVATNPACFLKKDDFEAHETRVAIGEGYTVDDEARPKLHTPMQYLKSADEMVELFSDLPGALENSVEIAKRCNVHLVLGKVFLPDFPVPEGQTIDGFLREESKKGLKARIAHLKKTTTPDLDEKAYEARLDLELDVIIKMEFPGYFLIVADFIRWAKNNGVPVGPGRGSGAGSIVAYALNITDLDPMQYDLLFERFLNPERVSMPDFDVDFCINGRDRVIEYVADKYGRSSVSQIITFGSMAAKAAIRDVGRAMGLSYGFVDSVAKLIPNELGITLTEALEDEAFKERYDNDDEVQPLIDMALRLEGTVRNVGKHAGGVVIAPSKLSDFTPVYCEEGSQQIVSQYDKDDVEAIGLVKFDFLGLRNLTIIDMAVKTINVKRKNAGETDLVIEDIPLADAETFKLLKRCHTTAVFQLESRGMKDLIRRLQPDSFEEIIALVALFRPGPLQSGMVDSFIERKHGREPVVYDHPDLEGILDTTYGIILYQEQVMKIAQVLANYTLGGADMLRRAMGKKKPEEMAKQREIFQKGAEENGINAEVATRIFDLMEKFAGYGFNKSHSAAYALVAYQTAYLKAHYCPEFMASVLSSDMDSTDKIVAFVDDCNELGIKILPPCINRSEFLFVVEEGNIRFGLGAVKGVGESALECVFEDRNESGPFKNLFAFCDRVNMRKVNKRVCEALILSGGMDNLGPTREALLATLPKAIKQAEQQSKNKEVGQHDMFGTMSQITEAPEFINAEPMSERHRLLSEKKVLGFFLSGHPMKEELEELAKMRVRPLDALAVTQKGRTAKVAGLVVEKRRIKTKRGSIMMILAIDDSNEKRDVVVFSDTLDKYKDKLVVDEILVIEGEVSPDNFTKGLRIVAKDIYTYDEARARYARTLKIVINGKQASAGAIGEVKALLEPHRGGQCPLIIEYHGDNAKARMLTNDWALQVSGQVITDLKKILSEEQVDVSY